MNLRNISDSTLLGQVKSLVGQEKNIVIQVIEHLREIETRDLHLLQGYSSMFKFATEYLGYSEAEAHIRIQAARLTQSIPEVKNKIISGELNLSVAAHAQSQFRKEDERREKAGLQPLKLEEKHKALALVNNCSRRVAEEKLSTHFSGPSDLKEFKFKGTSKLQQKIEALMDEYGHQNYERDLGKLIEILVDKEVARIDRKLNGPKKKVPKPESTKPATPTPASAKPVEAKPLKRSRIPISTKREVWKRTGKSCTYANPVTGQRCGSKHGIEIDHVVPLSQGGNDAPENLTILCDAHNRWKSDSGGRARPPSP